MSDIFFNRRDGYGLKLDEYKGKYKLVSGRQTEERLYLDWVFLSKWNKDIGGPEPDDKKRPMGAYLGAREDAIKALRFFLKELGASDPGDPAPDGSDDSIPF